MVARVMGGGGSDPDSHGTHIGLIQIKDPRHARRLTNTTQHALPPTYLGGHHEGVLGHVARPVDLPLVRDLHLDLHLGVPPAEAAHLHRCIIGRCECV